jgi:DNA-binding response OmpR family regulator
LSWLKKILGLEQSAQAPAPARAVAAPRSGAPSLAGERVLVADSSATIQKVLELTLESEGCGITLAGSLDEAIAALGRTPPTVVLVAAQLSDRDGLQVCEAVRRRPELRGTIVLVMRGAFETPLDEARVRMTGADGVLVKPFEPAALLDQVRALRAKRGQA